MALSTRTKGQSLLLPTKDDIDILLRRNGLLLRISQRPGLRPQAAGVSGKDVAAVLGGKGYRGPF